MEFATTRGRHIKTISEVRHQPKNTITSERKKVKHMNKLQLIDADTLYYKPLAHPKMLIDGVLSDGLAILAGDSKIGKSWMVLWLCLQISRRILRRRIYASAFPAGSWARSWRGRSRRLCGNFPPRA